MISSVRLRARRVARPRPGAAGPVPRPPASRWRQFVAPLLFASLVGSMVLSLGLLRVVEAQRRTILIDRAAFALVGAHAPVVRAERRPVVERGRARLAI